MSLRAKERFIEETGGFRLGESSEQFQQRQRDIQATTKAMLSGKLTLEERDRLQERLYKLKGLSSDEFPSYEEFFDISD